MKVFICISCLVLFCTSTWAQDQTDKPNTILPNAQGEYEVAAEVYIDMDAGANVFLDGIKIGSSPLTLSLSKALSTLTISGPKGNAKALLKVVAGLSSPSSLSLAWQAPLSTLSITTLPTGAEVLVNGQAKGISPIQLELPTGSYTISARRNRHVYTEKKVELGFSIPYNIELQGYAQHQVSFNQEPGEKAYFTITGPNGNSEYASQDEILLADGIYNLSIYNSILFSSNPLVFQVQGSDLSLNLDTLRQSGQIKLLGISPKSRVYINEAQVLADLNGEISFPTGFVKLEIIEQGFLPFVTEDLAILPASSTTVSYPRLAGIDSNRDTSSTIGWICSGLGLVVAGGSAIATYTDIFNTAFQFDRSTGETATIVGACVLGTGIINLIISAILDDDYRKQEAHYASYLQIPQNSDLEISTP